MRKKGKCKQIRDAKATQERLNRQKSGDKWLTDVVMLPGSDVTRDCKPVVTKRKCTTWRVGQEKILPGQLHFIATYIHFSTTRCWHVEWCSLLMHCWKRHFCTVRIPFFFESWNLHESQLITWSDLASADHNSSQHHPIINSLWHQSQLKHLEIKSHNHMTILGQCGVVHYINQEIPDDCCFCLCCFCFSAASSFSRCELANHKPWESWMENIAGVEQLLSM